MAWAPQAKDATMSVGIVAKYIVLVLVCRQAASSCLAIWDVIICHCHQGPWDTRTPESYSSLSLHLFSLPVPLSALWGCIKEQEI